MLVEQGENECTTRGKMSAEQGASECMTRVHLVHPNHNITIREPQSNQGGGGGLSCSVYMDFAPPMHVEQCAKWCTTSMSL